MQQVQSVLNTPANTQVSLWRGRKGGQGTSAGGQMPKQPEAMRTQKGVAVSKKLYLQKQGWRAGLSLRVFADPSGRAPLAGYVENVGVKYGSFHLHKDQNQPPS